MTTTGEYLLRVKVKTGVASDYGIAPILGLTRAAISRLHKPGATFGVTTAVRVAEVLEIDPLTVIADMELARAKTPHAREVWERMAARVAAAVVLGVGIGGLVAVLGDVPSPALLTALYAPGVCVLCKIALYGNLIDLAPLFVALAVSGLTLSYLSRSKS